MCKFIIDNFLIWEIQDVSNAPDNDGFLHCKIKGKNEERLVKKQEIYTTKKDAQKVLGKMLVGMIEYSSGQILAMAINGMKNEWSMKNMHETLGRQIETYYQEME